MATTAIIGLGSNLGDGKSILQEAWHALGRMAGVQPERLSSPYLTAPVDMTSHHWFTNAVGCLQVALPPLDLLKVLMAVEADFGRRREGLPGYRDRSLDLDLLCYGGLVMASRELTVPHPRLGRRLFVLTPFAELAPDFRHPVSGETIIAMEQRLRQAMAAGETDNQTITRGSWRGDSSAGTDGGRTAGDLPPEKA